MGAQQQFMSLRPVCQKENYNSSNQLPKEKASSKPPSTISVEPKHCKPHVGSWFCYDCVSYNICESCRDNHEGHTIATFSNFTQAKEATRERLLQNLEDTLQTLKSREGEVENRSAQVQLIQAKLKALEEDILSMVRTQFQSLQKAVHAGYYQAELRFQQQLIVFHEQYNRVNDSLREHLLDIIDGNIQFHTFCRGHVEQFVGDQFLPQFGKYKQALEKSRNFLRSVQSGLLQLEKVISPHQPENTDKYDRFLKEQTQNRREAEKQASLMRTLEIISSNHFELPLQRINR